jgi:hypothetical protein
MFSADCIMILRKLSGDRPAMWGETHNIAESNDDFVYFLAARLLNTAHNRQQITRLQETGGGADAVMHICHWKDILLWHCKQAKTTRMTKTQPTGGGTQDGEFKLTNGGSSSYARSPGVPVKAILPTYARSTVALGRAVYRHDRKKTFRPAPAVARFLFGCRY